jgi:predicted ATPase
VRITSLALQDLRRYREAVLEFAPGLTIVRGPNEAGKSTLQRAIELALTRKVTSSAADLTGLMPWDGGADARTTRAAPTRAACARASGGRRATSGSSSTAR